MVLNSNLAQWRIRMIDATKHIVRKAGAVTILTGLVLPWLVLGSVRVLSIEKDVAVIQNEEKNLVKILDKMDAKLDMLLQERRHK